MPTDDDEDVLGGPEGYDRVDRLIAKELGERAAKTFSHVWRAFDEWEQTRHPGEGLRERKKRLTRQRISDVATALFVTYGFDNVPISEIASKVGVSEKTIYNYFPTKESLVYDNADEQLERLAAAVRDREPGTSPIAAFVTELKAETIRLREVAGDERIEFLPAFSEMILETPALRAAWGEHRYRMVEEIAEALAPSFGVDPRDPEILIAARGLVSLLELFFDSQLRHISAGINIRELQLAVEADLDRGARLLETGFWSMQLLVEGRRTKAQLRDAAIASEQARQLVMKAFRDAKKAWAEVRDQARATGRDENTAARNEATLSRAKARQEASLVRANARAHAAEVRAEARAQAQAAREAGRSTRRPKPPSQPTD